MNDSALMRKSIACRRRVLEIIDHAGAGHTGGSLSCVDILTVLYNAVLRISPDNPGDPARDRYIQSKGHSVEALYAVLADRGFLPDEELQTLCGYRTRLIGHPTRKVPGIEQNTGALGHGLSFGVGAALGLRRKRCDARVYVLLGDGELAEGSNWEAAMSASHHRLDNITAVIDHNGLQITGAVRDVLGVDPLVERWAAFGWSVCECDGHDIPRLRAALRREPIEPAKPTLVVAHTVKGKGVSFMENEKGWHHRVPKEDELERALAELDRAAAELGEVERT